MNNSDNNAASLKHYDSVDDDTNMPEWNTKDRVILTPYQLETYDLLSMVGESSCGGVSSFVGTTRDHHNGKKVLQLEYEAFDAMAIKQMKLICVEARRKYEIGTVAMLHRLGVVNVGEASVCIAVSSEHRVDCLNAVHWCIDELKAKVPIWKKETYEDGTMWKANQEFNKDSLLSGATHKCC